MLSTKAGVEEEVGNKVSVSKSIDRDSHVWSLFNFKIWQELYVVRSVVLHQAVPLNSYHLEANTGS